MKPWRKLYASILDSDSLYGVSSEAIVLLIFLIVAQDDSGYYPWTPVKIERLIISRPSWNVEVAERYAKELESAGVLAFAEGGVMLIKGKELNGITRKDVAEELYQRNQAVNVPSTLRQRAVIIEGEGEGEEIKNKKEIRAPQVAFELPSWIEQDAWEAYMKMRKAKRAKVTDESRQELIKQLTLFKENGDDTNVILRRSVMNGWTGIFALGEERNTNGIPKGYSQKEPSSSERANAIRAEAERLGVDPFSAPVS